MTVADPTKPFMRRAKDALLWLAWQYPFFAIPAAKCKLVEDAGAETAYVTADGIIHLDPAFCGKLDNRQLAGILAHELCHPMFGHHSRRAGRQPMIWNLATDCSINGNLQAAGIVLPDGGILPQREWINQDGSPWCAERIYDAMIKDAPPQPQDGDGEGKSGGKNGAGKNGGNQPKRRPKPGQGCGVEDPEAQGDKADGGAADKSLAEIEREWREVAIQAATMQKQAGRGKGDALINIATVPPPKVDWPSILRQGQSLAQAAQGRDVTTWQKRGRRSGQLGPQFPGWIGTRACMAIVVDVSGSMCSQKVVDQCVSEVLAGVRESGVPAYLVTHDDGVQWAGWVRPGETAVVKAAFKGFGGTDAHEAYDRVRQLGRRIDVFIHLTDCYLRWPSAPSNCRKKIVARIDSGKDTPTPEWARVIDVELGR